MSGSIPSQFTARILIVFATLIILFVSGGCSSNSGFIPTWVTEAPKVIVGTNKKLSTAPHTFDIYQATNADKAVVFLHGAGGTKHYMAYQLGVLSSGVEGDYSSVDKQLILDNKVIAVFVQGQAIAAAPAVYTWSNYVMNSGQDDVQFLRDLVGYLTSQYHISRIYLAGHSNGGMMANRIWCEAPELFDAYAAIAGPPSERFLTPETACSPPKVKPYLAMVGSDDNVLQVTGHWEAPTWTINPILLPPGSPAQQATIDPVLAGERAYLPARTDLRCGATVAAGDQEAVTDGRVTTWSFCGDSIRLMRVEFAGHTLDSLQSVLGQRIIDIIFAFTRGT